MPLTTSEIDCLKAIYQMDYIKAEHHGFSFGNLVAIAVKGYETLKFLEMLFEVHHFNQFPYIYTNLEGDRYTKLDLLRSCFSLDQIINLLISATKPFYVFILVAQLELITVNDEKKIKLEYLLKNSISHTVIYEKILEIISSTEPAYIVSENLKNFLAELEKTVISEPTMTLDEYIDSLWDEQAEAPNLTKITPQEDSDYEPTYNDILAMIEDEEANPLPQPSSRYKRPHFFAFPQPADSSSSQVDALSQTYRK